MIDNNIDDNDDYDIVDNGDNDIDNDDDDNYNYDCKS